MVQKHTTFCKFGSDDVIEVISPTELDPREPERRTIEITLVSAKINIFDAVFLFEYYRCPPSIELIKIGGQI